jgi:hypothetical protein
MLGTLRIVSKTEGLAAVAVVAALPQETRSHEHDAGRTLVA